MPDIGIGLSLGSILGSSAPLPPYTPLDEPNTSFWFDATQSSTITFGVSPKIARWDSAKSNSVYIERATTTQQPELSSAAINGLDAVVFDNVDDSLTSSGATGDITAGSNLAVHWVGLHPAVGGVNFGTVFNHLNASEDRGIQIGRQSTGADARIQIRNSTAGPINCTGSGAFDGTVNVYSALAHTSRGTLQFLKNGEPIGTAAFTGDFSRTGSFINFGTIGGTIGEMVMVSNKAYDAEDVLKMVGYLAHRWGISNKLTALNPYRNAAPTTGAVPVGSISLFGTYGQSWAERNGANGAKTSLLTAQKPNSNFMVSEPAGITVDVAGETSFEAMFENDANVQSITGPMTLRYYDEKLSGLYLARHNGEGGKSMEELAKSTMSFYDGVSPFYADMLDAFNLIETVAGTYYKNVMMPYLYWCQGINNPSDTVSQYTGKMNEMFDGISDDANAIFSSRPTFMVVPQPGGKVGGEQPNIIAQLQVALTRADALLAYAGWAVEKHIDGLHFSTDACVDLGEIMAIKARHLETTGVKWHSPYCLDEHVSRSGTTITMNVQSLYDMVADETVASPSHYDGGSIVGGVYSGGTPVPDLGFEYEQSGGGNIAINSIVISGKTITIELASAVSGTLKFAYSNASRALISGVSYTVNRGNVRSVWTGTSTYTGNTLYDWMSSGSWDL